jgi:hypothetical protein
MNYESCTCEKCVRACEKTPGWFAPGEAEKVAEFMKMDFEEFAVLYLIKDHCDNANAEDAPYVWSPRKSIDGEEKIRLWANQWRRGTCIFLKEFRCSIHEVKPFECKNSYSCKGNKIYHIRDKIEQQYIDAGAPLGMRQGDD